MKHGHGAADDPRLQAQRHHSLYATLEVATGEVTGACYARHTHEQFLAFLNALVRSFPRKPLHVVLDSFSTHSTPQVKRWLERAQPGALARPGLNMVEIWFSILTISKSDVACTTTSPN